MKYYLIQINKGTNGYAAEIEVAATSEEEAIKIAQKYLNQKRNELADILNEGVSYEPEVRWCSVIMEDATLDIVNKYDMSM